MGGMYYDNDCDDNDFLTLLLKDNDSSDIIIIWKESKIWLTSFFLILPFIMILLSTHDELQFSQLITIRQRVGRESFPLIDQTFYPNYKEMVSNHNNYTFPYPLFTSHSPFLLLFTTFNLTQTWDESICEHLILTYIWHWCDVGKYY